MPNSSSTSFPAPEEQTASLKDWINTRIEFANPTHRQHQTDTDNRDLLQSWLQSSHDTYDLDINAVCRDLATQDVVIQEHIVRDYLSSIPFGKYTDFEKLQIQLTDPSRIFETHFTHALKSLKDHKAVTKFFGYKNNLALSALYRNIALRSEYCDTGADDRRDKLSLTGLSQLQSCILLRYPCVNDPNQQLTTSLDPSKAFRWFQLLHPLFRYHHQDIFGTVNPAVQDLLMAARDVDDLHLPGEMPSLDIDSFTVDDYAFTAFRGGSQR